MNNSRFQRSEEARRQAKADVLRAKERELAAAQERAALFAIETTKVENLRALRLARPATDQGKQPRHPRKAVLARKVLAA